MQGIEAAGATLDHADFTGANFAPAEPSDLCPDLTPSELSNVSARNTKFTRATLTRVKIDNSNLVGANFENANISGASMNNAKFGTYSMPARPEAKQQTRGAAGRLTMQLGKAIVEAADSEDDSGDDDEDDDDEDDDEQETDGNATQMLLQASLTKSVERLASAIANAVPQVIAASQKADQAINEAVKKAKEALDSKTGGEALCALESTLSKAASCTDRTAAATAIGELMQKELNSLLNEVFDEAGTLSKLLNEAKVEVAGAVGEVSSDASKLAQAGAELGLSHVLKILRRTVEKHANLVLKKLASAVAEEIGGRFAPSAAAAQRLVVVVSIEAERLLAPADTYREALKSLLDRVEACLDKPEVVVQQWLLQQGGKLLQRSTGGRGGLATLGRRTTIFEEALASKLDTEQAKVASTESLGDQLNARVRSQIAKRALKGTSRYAATGRKAMINLVVSTDPLVLTKHEKELMYLLEKLAKLEDADVTSELWQDFYESWVSFLALRSQLEAECAQQIFEAVATDEAVLTGLGGAHLFKDAVMESGPGQVPNELLVQLKQGPGKHIKSNAYAYRHKIDAELTKIGRIRSLQQRAVALTGTAIISVSVGTCNVLGQLYYDVLKSNRALAGVIAGVAISAVLLVCITFAACVRRVRK